jgi:hypothetical protein
LSYREKGVEVEGDVGVAFVCFAGSWVDYNEVVR